MTTILILVPDLMFATRVEDAAKRLGYTVESLNVGDDPVVVMARVSPALLVVSLDAPGWQEAVVAAKNSGARVLAFGSHKSVDTLVAARAAGCDEVVARSRMAAELPSLLKKHAV